MGLGAVDATFFAEVGDFGFVNGAAVGAPGAVCAARWCLFW